MCSLSIVVNNYNYARFLAQAIESALAQTVACEVVVVDDGSTDESREIIEQYQQRGVRAILKENGGQASALNAGFLGAKGDFILFLDADDFLLPTVAENVLRVANCELSKVHFRLRVADGQGLESGIFPPVSLKVRRPLDQVMETGFYATPPTSGNAYSRRFLQQVLPIPEAEWRLSADAYLNILAPFYGNIEAIDKALGTYRIHGSNHCARVTPKLLAQLRDRAQLRHMTLSRAAWVQKRLKLDYLLDRNYRYWLLETACAKMATGGRLSPALRAFRAIRQSLSGRKRALAYACLAAIILPPRRLARYPIQWFWYPASCPRFLTRWVRRLSTDSVWAQISG